MTTEIERAVDTLRQADPILAAIIEYAGPCTLRADGDFFLTLVDSIVSQQLSIKAAATILARLNALCGQNQLTPAGILAHSEDELRGVGLSRPKARYLLDLASKVQEGTLDLNTLPEESDESVIERLVQVKGIGRWTAEMFLIFALGRLNVLPVDDLGLATAVQQAYHLDHRPTKSELLALGEKWQPYRTIATWYFWRSRDALGEVEYGQGDKETRGPGD